MRTNAPYLVSILSLAAAGTANAAPSFMPKSHVNAALQIRGGGALGPIDASTVVKTASVLAGVQGVVMQFAPEDTGVSYGLDEEDMKKESNKLGATVAGTSILTWAATLAYLVFVKDATASGAYLTNIHVWIYENLRIILGKTVEGTGGENSNPYKVRENGMSSIATCCLASPTSSSISSHPIFFPC